MNIHRAKTKEQYRRWIESCFQYALEFQGLRDNVKIGSTSLRQVKVETEQTTDGERIYTVAMEHENGDREMLSFLGSGKIDGYYYWPPSGIE